MAALIATGGFASLHWALYGLLSFALAWLSGRDDRLRVLPALGLAVALLLAAVWPDPAEEAFVAVMFGLVAIYGGFAITRLWREMGSMLEAGQIAAIALGGYAIALFHYRHPGSASDHGWAMLALALALLPATAASLGWANPARPADARFATLSISAAVLVAVAGFFGLPDWTLPITLAGVAALLLILSNRAEDDRIEAGALSFLLTASALMPFTDLTGHELPRLAGIVAQGDRAQALMRWLALAATTTVFAWRMRNNTARRILQAVAALWAYGAAAQVVPPAWLVISIACGMLIITEIMSS